MKTIGKIITILGISGSMLSAQIYKTMDSHGSAPLTCKDGYQVVSFSNGSTYHGEFLNCHPVTTQEGRLETDDGMIITGLFEAVGDDKVKYEDALTSIEISVELVPVGY